MVSKYDAFYEVFLSPGLTASQTAQKLGKDQLEYGLVLRQLKQLVIDKLVKYENKKYYPILDGKNEKFAHIITFCLRNKIDYNELFLDSTIKFIKLGLEKQIIENLPFHSKTSIRATSFLSKHGFLLVESRKPFMGRIVCSDVLLKVVELLDKKPAVKCLPIYESVDEKELNNQIEREFSIYKKATKIINTGDEVQFIYRSLSLEGNTLTLPETEKLLKDNIPPESKAFSDMVNTVHYKTALDKLLANKTYLNPEMILSFHSSAMESLPAGAGEFRTQAVRIRNNPDYKTADWHEIPRRLNELFKYYNESINKKMKPHEVIELASYLHAEFQRIHPFVDGNSRTSRALFAHTLILKGFPIVLFPAGFVDQYLGLTKLSKERNDKHFEIFMKQLVLHSLKQINWKMRFS